MKSSMLSNPNEALSQNAFPLVAQVFSMNAASGGLKSALKMIESNGKFKLSISNPGRSGICLSRQLFFGYNNERLSSLPPM